MRVHLKFAAREEKDRIEIVKVLGVEFESLLGERFRVGADRGVPQPGLLAQALDRG